MARVVDEERKLYECTRCRRMYPRGQFVRRNDTELGLGSWCRGCRKPLMAAGRARRRARLLAAGRYEASDVERLMVLQGGLCAHCARSLHVFGYHVDHVQALARGGSNTRDNIQLLCPRCNLRKAAR